MGFDALQLRIVNASVLLRLIVDAGRRRRREVGFPLAPAQGKRRDKSSGWLQQLLVVWPGLLGVNARKSHVLGSDERGASHQPKLRIAVFDQPRSMPAVTRHGWTVLVGVYALPRASARY
jgi:hypothetical protein